jgi:hypothetical protein
MTSDGLLKLGEIYTESSVHIRTVKVKAVPLHVKEVLGGTEGTAPTTC